MTDIPVYNEKEISIKDISLCYKSDRRAQDVRGILKSLCKCIRYTRYIINDASVDKNQHNLGEIKG